MFYFPLLALVFGGAAAVPPPAANYVLPPAQIGNESVIASKVAGYSAFDGVWIPQPNITSYEWWYFDAVASDLSASVVFQPVLTYSDAQPLALRLNFIYPNQTHTEFTIPYESVWVSTIGSGSSGISNDGSWSWHETADLSSCTIHMDIPEYGIEGSIRMDSIAPPHTASGPAGIDADLAFNWDLYWANAIPDSQATVNLNINGTEMAFIGSGYHDKNWAPFNFIPNMNQWFWGHGRAGEYSVVWFYHLDKANSTSVTAYIARDYEILHVADHSVVVRPFGENITYPLEAGFQGAALVGYEISIDAGALGQFAFTTTKKQITTDPGVYTRWIGTIDGGLVGHTNQSGPALWELMGPFGDVPFAFG